MSDHFPLSLHHLTALDATPAQLVELARDNGCAHVCLFTYVPEAARAAFPMVMPEDVPALKAVMDACSVTACNLEVFPLDGTDDVAGFASALETGAALGATRATAHIHELADEAEAIARFAAFCDQASEHGIMAGLEFNAFSAVNDIDSAARIVRGAGRRNGQLVCDALHLFRNGGSVEAVAAQADIIGYAQFCDGPMERDRAEWWREAVGTRELPGRGEFPLTELASALRDGTVVEVEIPRKAEMKEGVPAADRVRAAVAAVKSVLP